MEDIWYLRSRGKISGPFDLSQIGSLIRRKQISRHDELSHDKSNWRRAVEFTELFVPLVERKVRKQIDKLQPEIELESDAEASKPEGSKQSGENLDNVAPKWYVARNGEPSGPFSLGDLMAQLTNGQITHEDQVWSEGMEAWVAASSLEHLSGKPSGGSQRSASASESSSEPSYSGLAITSMVLGILGITFLFGVASVPAVVFGHFALAQIGRDQNRLRGRGMAVAGVVLGYVSLGLVALTLAFVLISHVLNQ